MIGLGSDKNGKLYSFLILMMSLLLFFVTSFEAVELPIGSCLISGGLAVSWFCYGTSPKQLFIAKFGIQSNSSFALLHNLRIVACWLFSRA